MPTQCFLNNRPGPPKCSRSLFSVESVHDSRTIFYWVWLTEREWFYSVWALGLKIQQLLHSSIWVAENLNTIQATHELWKKQTIMRVLEEHRPMWRLGRIEYKLNGNIINLHSGCVIQADWKADWEIKVCIWEMYIIVEFQTAIALSCNQAFRLESTMHIWSHWTRDLCSLSSPFCFTSFLSCSPVNYLMKQQCLKDCRKM